MLNLNTKFLLVYFLVLNPLVSFAQNQSLDRKNFETALLGKRAQFQCSVQSPDAAEVEIWWEFEGKNITQNGVHYEISVIKSADGTISSELSLETVEWKDEGTYTCSAREAGTEGAKPTRQEIMLEIYADPKVMETSNGNGQVGGTAELSCTFTGRPVPTIKWLGFGKEVSPTRDPQKYHISTIDSSERKITSMLKIMSLSHADNGTYLCHGENDYGTSVAVMEAVVYDKPEVKLDVVEPVGTDKVFFNWTVNDWNAPITDYFLSFRESGESAWVYFISEKIPPDAIAFVMSNLTANSTYLIKLAAKNAYGMGEFDLYHSEVTTLSWDPTFVPEVGLKGLTWNSISIGWTNPPELFTPFIQYYKLTRKTDEAELNVYQPSGPNFYLWRNLNPATDYSFTVSACNGFTKLCGPPSNVVSGTTEDGLSGPPTQVSIFCRHDNISGMNFVDVNWQPPIKPGGQIEFYNITLTGLASYVNSEGKSSVDKFGPELKTDDAKSTKTRFDFLLPNTNYTAQVCAVTRRKECGKVATVSCKMRQTAPRREQLNRVQWFNDRRNGKDIFRLRLPKMTERNGKICCMRVVLVRMKEGQGHEELPDQELLPMKSYRKVHERDEAAANGWGAYIAEILGPNFMGRDVYVGDGQNILSSHVGSGCPACQTGVQAHLLRTEKSSENLRFARNVAIPTELIEDGFLDPYSNYTAFVEVIVPTDGTVPDPSVVGRSPYMSPRKPGQIVSFLGEPGQTTASTALISVLGVLAGLVAVALFLLIALILLKRYSKQVAATQGGVEMDLRRSFRHLCNTLRRGRDHSQYLITPRDGEPVNLTKSGTGVNGGHRKPVDMPSLAKSELVQAYLERHKDSDYGFQSEFELLPDGYPDRTHEIGDRPVNRPKNRYPDIKCYDQTRVKLAPLPDYSKIGLIDNGSDDGSDDGSIPTLDGSDYINANMVFGYKDRKKWICAQGPLEHTVGDFWRMIHEQRVEMIIMLTNLEEYNRVKCAQYWPQAGDLNYLATPNLIINVRFCTEKRLSDYIVRELTMTVKTSKRGVEQEKIVRTVRHYHYLQWKDFNAPEHAPGMLHFVKRINEEASRTSDRPIVVHCSAGVGRSGTLIAIDSLSQQLREEGKVAIYKTVCDLRHYRNYLVQSVKQYMFVYRAIMEVGQFGDTEIEASKLKSTWMEFVSDDIGQKKLEEEFTRLASIVDDRKALSVGTNEENKLKNQSETVIPYDRNRVILTPDGMKPHSTYINASFIEGYHNDESFIITQDPMLTTVEDFWRMIVEHNICTMVQLTADQTDGFGYWSASDMPGSEATFGAMKVTLDTRETLPSYVKREFTVYNQKCEEEVHLSHFAYSSWKSTENIPETTYGLLDLVEHATAHKVEASLPGPIAVHCKLGSDRSSVYVALSCLVQQLKTESRADVFTVVRKLRSQRQGMVQQLDQYKFIYRAIADYVDLYRSKDDEYDYSVPVNSLNNKTPNGTLRK